VSVFWACFFGLAPSSSVYAQNHYSLVRWSLPMF